MPEMWQVVGQERVLRLIRRALKDNRLPHANLITGPAGVGKTTLALDLARAVNCTSASSPCGECNQCKRITSGHHTDVQILAVDAGNQDRSRAEIGINAIRELRHAASLRPYEGRSRVFIVDQADRLSKEAANSLLKTLEEPPSGVFLILLTIDNESVPLTIRSRCQSLALAQLPSGQVAQLLVDRYGVEEDRALGLARLARGCPGWAIRAANDPTVLDDFNAHLNLISALPRVSLKGRFDYAQDLAAKFQRHRQDGREELFLWLRWWRDVLLKKVGLGHWATCGSKDAQLMKQSNLYSLAQLTQLIRCVESTIFALDRNVNPRLALELLLLSVPHEGVGPS